MISFKPLFFFLLISLLSSKVHEDAEDKKTSRWKLINVNTYSKIKNIYDLDKQSRIIAFQGEGTKNIYELRTKQVKEDEYWLSWQMKFSEDFVIIVMLETNVGKRYLVYTPGDFQGYMHYGLGEATTNGTWQTINRNLQEDIAYFDNRIDVLALKSFVLKGNGSIDNIVSKKNIVSQRENFRKAKKNLKKMSNSIPSISIKGVDLIHLNLGDVYVEEGVSAYDKEDGELNVVSMENIDSNQEGRYMVLYMATDNDGNMALDKRYVQIGKVEEAEIAVKTTLNERDVEAIEEYSLGDKIDFSEAEKQIQIWEKELELREKELAVKEKNSNKN